MKNNPSDNRIDRAIRISIEGTVQGGGVVGAVPRQGTAPREGGEVLEHEPSVPGEWLDHEPLLAGPPTGAQAARPT